MKRYIALIICICFALGTVGVMGCSSGSSSQQESYSHSVNDGHLHIYEHRLHPDEYVCSECGHVFDGDPSTLREM